MTARTTRRLKTMRSRNQRHRSGSIRNNLPKLAAAPQALPPKLSLDVAFALALLCPAAGCSSPTISGPPPLPPLPSESEALLVLPALWPVFLFASAAACLWSLVFTLAALAVCCSPTTFDFSAQFALAPPSCPLRRRDSAISSVASSAVVLHSPVSSKTKLGEMQHPPEASSCEGGYAQPPSQPTSAPPAQRPEQSLTAAPLHRPAQSATAPESHVSSQPKTPGPLQRRTCRAPQWLTRAIYPPPHCVEHSVHSPHSFARHFSPHRSRATAGRSGSCKLPNNSGYVQKNTAGRQMAMR
mmetsp:Transcript_11940/g.28957  ORF Transcript_11940/g.28957 Transcript_11940/m.28957 type:complete len:298 (-) Transcript_11940:885-1778(-)